MVYSRTDLSRGSRSTIGPDLHVLIQPSGGLRSLFDVKTVTEFIYSSWLLLVCSRPCGDGALSVPGGPTGGSAAVAVEVVLWLGRSAPNVVYLLKRDSKPSRCRGRWSGMPALVWKSCDCPHSHHLTDDWPRTSGRITESRNQIFWMKSMTPWSKCSFIGLTIFTVANKSQMYVNLDTGGSAWYLVT